MIAYLTHPHYVKSAAHDIAAMSNVARFSRAQLRGEFKDGSRFVIFSDGEQLMGHEVDEYRILNTPSQRLIEVAKVMAGRKANAG